MGQAANRELPAQWGQQIAAQRRSGLTVAEFCRQRGVSIGSSVPVDVTELPGATTPKTSDLTAMRHFEF
jgi:hypothetical protein